MSALAACSGDTAAPVVKPGVAAGKVLEVSGTVTATRGATTRDLVTGDEVSGDDTIKTGPDGRIAILLDHNRARWELGASKTAVVSGSLAWTAARQAGAGGASDEATLAAGRHAEKTGADTGATATEQKLAPPGARAEPTDEAVPAVAPPAPEPRQDRAPDAPPASPPAAQPPPPRRAVTAMAPTDRAPPTMGGGGLGMSGTGEGGGGTGDGIGLGTIGSLGHGGGTGAGYGKGSRGSGGGASNTRSVRETDAVATGVQPDAPPPPPPVPLLAPTPANVQAALRREQAAIATCLGDQASLAVEVIVTAGKLRFVLGAGAPAALPGCLGVIAARLRFDPAAAPVRAPLTLTK